MQLILAGLVLSACVCGLGHGIEHPACEESSLLSRRHVQKESQMIQKDDASSRQSTTAPHILFILVDDLGWAGVEYHHGPCDPRDEACRQAKRETNTPRINALARHGIRLEQHYAFQKCSPSRCALQSGRLPQHVNLQNTPVESMNPNDPISGYNGIPRNMTGMGEKMQALGYKTHFIGKWDVGMATPQHTPKGRGYDTALFYFQHSNDYWTKVADVKAHGEVSICYNSSMPIRDLFEINATYRGPVQDDSLLSTDMYEEEIFKTRAKQIIADHAAAKDNQPLFLFYSSHLVHAPLEVPEWYQNEVQRLAMRGGGINFTSKRRMIYAAMTLYFDQAVGELVDELRHQHMYDNTLIVFTSDNGGPIYEIGGANNHPLKGGKFSDWEGGVKTNAFVSGGYVPSHRRNTRHDSIVSIADWYPTLCEIGGGTRKFNSSFCVTDYKAEAANKWIERTNPSRNEELPILPGIDGVPQWNHIVHGTNGRPGPFWASEVSVVDWPFKLLIGVQKYSGWTGHLYPNCSSIRSLMDGNGPAFCDMKVYGRVMEPTTSDPAYQHKQYWEEDCGDKGCLFNLEQDPSEHHNLAFNSEYDGKRQELLNKLRDFNQTAFRPNRGSGSVAACNQSWFNGHFYGPFADLGDFYTNPSDPAEFINETFLEALQLWNSITAPGAWEVNKGAAWFVFESFEMAAPAQYLSGSDFYGNSTPFDTCFAPFNAIADREVTVKHS